MGRFLAAGLRAPLLLTAALIFATCGDERAGGAAGGPAAAQAQIAGPGSRAADIEAVSIEAAASTEDGHYMEERIAARILERMTPFASPGFDAHAWNESRFASISLFIEVFNNRADLSVLNIFDAELSARLHRLRMEAFELLSDEIGAVGWGSDGTDVRAGEMAMMVSFMTLGILSQNLSFGQSNFFIESAKTIVRGDMWFGYPGRYNIVSLLDILLTFNTHRGHHLRDQIILGKLIALENYLYEIESPDDPYWHERDREFVTGLIAEMQTVVAGN